MFLRDIKYPFSAEHTPIGTSENERIFIASVARLSSINTLEIMGAPKNTIAFKKAPTPAERSADFFTTESTLFLFPHTISSEQSLVTAVQIPLEAKVEASIYTEIINW